MIAVRLTLFGIMLCLAVGSTPVSAFEPTGCQVAGGMLDVGDGIATAPVLDRFAAMARAKDRGDRQAEIDEARRAARLMARYHRLSMEMFLAVAQQLSSDAVVSRDAVTALAQGLLDILDPIAGQKSEMDADMLRAYLRALHHVNGATHTNSFKSLSQLHARIEAADICFERRFFLLLELTTEIGDRHGRTEVRPRLEELRRQSNALRGITVDNIPLKWYALHELTFAAVRFRQFDLAHTWLAATIREAELLKQTGSLNADSKDIIESAMAYSPEYVADREDRFRRRRAADLD